MGQVHGSVRRELEIAVSEGNWERVQRIARAGLNTDELKALAGMYNSETTAERLSSQTFQAILRYCSSNQIDSVCKEIVKLCLWRSVGVFLDHGVSENIKSWAVSQALNRAGDNDLSDILPHCTDEQFSECFRFATERCQWKAISRLVRRKSPLWLWLGLGPEYMASCYQRQDALGQALALASDEDLSILLPLFVEHKDMRQECLKGAVMRGLWVAVHTILLDIRSEKSAARESLHSEVWNFLYRLFWPVQNNEGVYRWALQQVAKRAESQVLVEFSQLFLCGDILKWVLPQMIGRKLWREASDLLGYKSPRDTSEPSQQNASNDNNDTSTGSDDSVSGKDTAYPNTSEESASCDPQPPSEFDEYDTRIDFILTQSLERAMWKAVGAILKQHTLRQEQLIRVTTEIAKAADVQLGRRFCPINQDFVLPTNHLQSLLSLLDETQQSN